MDKIKRITTIICLTAILCLSFSSCSDKKEKVTLNEEEINSKYDEIVKNSSSDAQDEASGQNSFFQSFGELDYTFSSQDDTEAFSLDENSFAKLTPTQTYYNKIAPGNDVVTYEGVFKTARGLNVLNTATEIISAYNTDLAKSVVKSIYDGNYNVAESQEFCGKFTAAFGANDDGSYAQLELEDVKKLVTMRDANANGMYMNTALVTDEFSQYKTIAVMDIVTDSSGQVNEIDLYRFDK